MTKSSKKYNRKVYSPILLSKKYLTRAQCKLVHSKAFNVSKHTLFKLDDTIEPNFYSISRNPRSKSRLKSRSTRNSRKSLKSKSRKSRSLISYRRYLDFE